MHDRSNADQLRTDPLDHTGSWRPFLDLAESPHPWAMRVTDEGRMLLDAEGHRLVVTSTLVEKERTAKRFWTLVYDRADDPWEDGRGVFHVSSDAAIARNNLIETMERLTGNVVTAMDGPMDPDPHWLVHKTLDHPDVRFPNPALADRAANYWTRRGLDDEEDGPYRVFAVDQETYEQVFDGGGGDDAE